MKYLLSILSGCTNTVVHLVLPARSNTAKPKMNPAVGKPTSSLKCLISFDLDIVQFLVWYQIKEHILECYQIFHVRIAHEY